MGLPEMCAKDSRDVALMSCPSPELAWLFSDPAAFSLTYFYNKCTGSLSKSWWRSFLWLVTGALSGMNRYLFMSPQEK